jgi:hypothetical protein
MFFIGGADEKKPIVIFIKAIEAPVVVVVRLE